MTENDRRILARACQEDKWVIPESMMEYEKKIVALEQRCKELEESQQKNCSGVEGGIYEVHSDKVYSTMKQEIDKLKTENAELRKRVSLLDNLYKEGWYVDDTILRQTYDKFIKMKCDITQT